MSTYFIFSDENGTYQQTKTRRFLRAHPFYVRSALVMNAEEWHFLNNEYRKLKDAFGLPQDKEIKWAYAWTLRSHHKTGKKIAKSDAIYFLKDYDYHRLVAFIESALQIVNRLAYKRIICTIADNSQMPKTNESDFLKMHVQNIMQRAQYELQFNKDNLGVIFVDTIGNDRNKHLKDACFDIFQKGDFIKKYSNLKDSIAIEYSHQSTGIQLADFIAGAFCSFIKAQHQDNYAKGAEMYKNSIHPNLRKGPGGKILGYGVIVVPTNAKFRDELSLIYGLRY